jgi:putative toxin-antitoxin system antitoxin component (TIGR02293 family)
VRILDLDAIDELQLVARLEHGLDPDSVNQLARHLDVPLKEILELTDIKSSTFHGRSKRGEPLSPEESERVYRLAKITEAAERYFEDQAAAHRWLAHPKTAFGGKAPLDFARTAEGANYVVSLLGRMAHGVVS